MQNISQNQDGEKKMEIKNVETVETQVKILERIFGNEKLRIPKVLYEENNYITPLKPKKTPLKIFIPDWRRISSS